MKRIFWGVAGLLLCAAIVYALELDRVLYPSMTPQEALSELLAGNARYTENKAHNPQHLQQIRAGLVSKQMPFAVVLGCSDSRVPPELVFDQNIGDIFVVRVAGNVAGPVELASIGYAINALKAKLIMVLGHENCGAVTAVMKHKTEGIEVIAKLIEPAIAEACHLCGNGLEESVKMNVHHVVAQLKANPAFRDLIRSNKLDVVGGYYHLKSGQVEVLDKEKEIRRAEELKANDKNE